MTTAGIGNNKGGTGKTTIVMGLAAALAARQRRVLVIDLDPQANLSRRMGWAEDQLVGVPTVSEAIRANEEGVAGEAIVGCRWQNEPTAERIDLLPSRIELENRVAEAGQVGAHRRLRKALAGVTANYDVTLIDLPPSLGHLTQMGLAAADMAVAVLVPEYDGVQGGMRFRDFIARHREDLGAPDLTLAGIVVNLMRPTDLHQFHADGLAAEFGADRVWQPYLRQRAALADAQDSAVPIHAVKGRAAGEMAEAFSQLAGRLDQPR